MRERGAVAPQTRAEVATGLYWHDAIRAFLHPAATRARQPVRKRLVAARVAGSRTARGTLARRASAARRNRRTRRRRVVCAAAGRSTERAAADPVEPLGRAHRPYRADAAVATGQVLGGRIRTGRGRLRCRTCRVRAHRAVRPGLAVHSLDRLLRLPAGDDRRRGAGAAGCRQRRAGRARAAEAAGSFRGCVLDFGPVDDRDHRRLRRKPQRDRGAAR